MPAGSEGNSTAAVGTWLLVFPSHRDALTIARSFNCGWRVANPIRPGGAAEPIRIQTTNCLGQYEPQPSRWDGLCWRAPNPQLKLRAIIKRAAGAPPSAIRRRLPGLVRQFTRLPGKPRIFICHPAVVPGKGNYGNNEAGVLEEIPNSSLLPPPLVFSKLAKVTIHPRDPVAKRLRILASYEVAGSDPNGQPS